MRVVKNIDYHRNGVGGEGFYVCTFTDIVDGIKLNMMAITFHEDPSAVRTAVFDTDLLATGDCRFFHNSWRGDHWHAWMMEQIEFAKIKDEWQWNWRAEFEGSVSPVVNL